MEYFSHCTDTDQLRAEYRRQSKLLHPDHGGSADDFARMRAEYDRRMNGGGHKAACRRRREADIAQAAWTLFKTVRPREADALRRLSESTGLGALIQKILKQ